MQKYISVLRNCALFDGIADENILKMLTCMSGQILSVPKGGFVLSEGNRAEPVGILLSGTVHIITEDYWGMRTILAAVLPGELFGESYACAKSERIAVSVEAASAAEVLLLDYKKLITVCSGACVFHSRAIENMLYVIAQKNVILTEKMMHITRRTTREKVLSYLSAQAKRTGADEFAIPFNRQELADFLAVDRSALSAELSRLKKEGLLEYRKNRFKLTGGAAGLQ
ncbi:MAG: Crp/Fnr family transcriptional regulator [Oscillospiraceae bacterium]|jgi:CRP-like cAMP-binding protein|nr:Crp/Fnr family transcriptional regulator [Oscillospiraceae bacterium]